METYTIQNMSGDSMWVPAMFGFILAGIAKVLLGTRLLVVALEIGATGRTILLVLGVCLQGSIILLFVTLFLMAAYYAKRPRITHRFSKFLCKIFYKTYRNKSKPNHYVRFRRMWVAVIVSLLCVLLFVL